MKMINTGLLAMAICGVTIPAAQARPNTLDMSCQQARNVVHSNGGIVLSTGRHTYDRYVVNHAFCPLGDYAKQAYVPTRDKRSCSIGYTCTPDNPWPFWGDD
jgi:hypothetical protein